MTCFYIQKCQVSIRVCVFMYVKIWYVSRVQRNIVCVPVILRLEELEFLLDTVQSFQDCELERLAGLQGDLHRKKRKRRTERKDENIDTEECVCVCVCVCVCSDYHVFV